MKIIKVQALRGPNIWSIQRKKLIQMRLDLEEMEQFPTNKIEGFKERIEAMFPTMIEHRCSEGCRGGFFSRVERGTWMGHVIEHIALEIQTLAGMETGFGRTRETKTLGTYNVVFSYLDSEELVKPKPLGLTMLFSATRKRMLVFLLRNLPLQLLKL